MADEGRGSRWVGGGDGHLAIGRECVVGFSRVNKAESAAQFAQQKCAGCELAMSRVLCAGERQGKQSLRVGAAQDG